MAPKVKGRDASKPTELFIAEHNVLGFYEKSDKSNPFVEMIDFLLKSNIHYSLTMDPIIWKEIIAKFWDSTHKSVDRNEVYKVDVKVNGHEISITKELIRKHMKFNNEGGDPEYNFDVYIQTYEAIGYGSDLNNKAIKNRQLSYVWRYLGHIILHNLSHMKTTWDELVAPQSSAFHG